VITITIILTLASLYDHDPPAKVSDPFAFPIASQSQKLTPEAILRVKNGENLITIAVNKSDLTELTFLIGELPASVKINGVKAALQRAIERDNSKMVLSVSKYHEAKEVRIDGMTSLSYAAFRGSLKSLSFLASCTNNFQRDDSGRIAMHYAVVSGPSSIRKLSTSADILNCKDLLGSTPLHYAARSRLDSVKELLRLGANREVTDLHGKKPIEYAKERFSAETANLAFAAKPR